MKTDYETESRKLLSDLQHGIQAANDHAQECAEIVASMTDQIKLTPFESDRQAIESALTALFASSWSDDLRGISLLTRSSEQRGLTAEPNTLVVRVDDSGFDAAVYDDELVAATIRQLAAKITNHDAANQPTVEFLAAAAEITRVVVEAIGYVSHRRVCDTESFGLSPFSDYVNAAAEANPATMRHVRLEIIANVASSEVVGLFHADGGPLKLVDKSDIVAEWTEDESAAVLHAEADGDFAGRDQIVCRVAARVHANRSAPFIRS